MLFCIHTLFNQSFTHAPHCFFDVVSALLDRSVHSHLFTCDVDTGVYSTFGCVLTLSYWSSSIVFVILNVHCGSAGSRDMNVPSAALYCHCKSDLYWILFPVTSIIGLPFPSKTYQSCLLSASFTTALFFTNCSVVAIVWL